MAKAKKDIVPTSVQAEGEESSTPTTRMVLDHQFRVIQHTEDNPEGKQVGPTLKRGTEAYRLYLAAKSLDEDPGVAYTVERVTVFSEAAGTIEALS